MTCGALFLGEPYELRGRGDRASLSWPKCTRTGAKDGNARAKASAGGGARVTGGQADRRTGGQAEGTR